MVKETKLTRHAVDESAARANLESGSRLLDGLLEPSADAPPFYLIAQTGFKLAGNGVVTDLKRPEICRGLRTASKTLSSLFAIAAAKGEIEVDLGDGEPRTLGATGPTSFTDCGNWREGFYAACICRNLPALDILAGTPMETLRHSSSKSDEAFYLFVAALQALWLRADDTGQKLLATLKATDPDQVKLTPEWVLNVLVPEIDLAFRLADADAEGFNQALRFALERHKSYWSKGDRKRQSVGYLARGPLAFASLAHDAGIPITVESDYMPAALWEGGCSAK